MQSGGCITHSAQSGSRKLTRSQKVALEKGEDRSKLGLRLLELFQSMLIKIGHELFVSICIHVQVICVIAV